MRWVEADRCRLRQVGMGEEGRGGLRGGVMSVEGAESG